MTAADSAERAQHHYDPRDVQEKWQARWAALDLFRASDDPEDTRPRTYLLDMFPYPSGDLLPPRAQRAAPYWLGCLRAARGERGDQEQHAPGRLDLRQHRDPGGVVPALCHLI